MKGASVERIEAAVLRTVLYGDVFNFPMTAEEIHYFLIHDEPVSLEAVVRTIETSGWLSGMLDCEGGYYTYRGRGEIVKMRQQREQAAQTLWPEARRYGVWLARLPFVRMVALTGALAVRNPSDTDDDLDYMLITVPRRVWLARAFSILLVRVGRLRGVEICPNYVLAENMLEQPQHNIFIAHEVTQMLPLYDQDIYPRFRAVNDWVADYLPNAEGPFYKQTPPTPGRGWMIFKNALEGMLAGKIGDTLERWEYQRKLRRFAPEMQKPHSSARLDDNQIKGHFNDHGHPVLRRYDDLLRECGLKPHPEIVPGD